MSNITSNNNIFDTKLSNFRLIFTFIICIIPILFFSEQDIQNSKLLISLSNYFVDIFPNIENGAMLGEKYNIYHFIKLQMFFTIIAICINLPFGVYKYTKLYLCSLEYIPYEKGYFFEDLNKDGVIFIPLHAYLFMVFLLFFMIDFHFTGTYFIMNEDVSILIRYIYNSKISMIIFFYLIANAGSTFPVIVILDGLAHIRKFKLNRKKNN